MSKDINLNNSEKEKLKLMNNRKKVGIIYLHEYWIVLFICL